MTLAPYILEQLRGNDPELTSLELNSEFIEDEDVCLLADALIGNTNLISLCLGDNDIGYMGASALARMLKVNHTLTTLEIWNNAIGDDGATAMAGALKVNHTLNKLDLATNAIKAEGAIALAAAMEKNTGIALLDLDGNAIGTRGKKALATALSANKNIVYIEPATAALAAFCKANETTVKNLIKKIRNDQELMPDEYQEIKARIPAVFYIAGEEWGLSQTKTLAMLAGIGITPRPGIGLFTNKIREAQRQAALDDPSQGI